MRYLNRSELERYGYSATLVERARFAKQASAVAADATVFLSHSHLDRNLIEPTINLFAGVGVNVYVDWKDLTLPAEVSAETARRLREKLREVGRFVLLATENALRSRWVPWELGCADGVKRADDVAVLPVQEDRRTWPGNEYVGLYPSIRPDNAGVLRVYRQGDAIGIGLAEWLRRRQAIDPSGITRYSHG